MICRASRNVLVASALISFPIAANSIVFTGTAVSGVSGMTLAASVNFQVSGSNLLVTLANTSASDVLVQGDILTAVFYDISGTYLALNPAAGSAVVAAGSTVLFGTPDPGGVVGGEWAYAENIGSNLSAGTGGQLNTQRYGISSSGFGVFGSANFPGTNLEGPQAVNGVQYGLTSAGDNPATGQSAVTGTNGLIKNSVVFTLPTLPGGFDLNRIGHVFFQYGTALSPTDPGIHGNPVPEPATVAVVALGLLALAARRR